MFSGFQVKVRVEGDHEAALKVMNQFQEFIESRLGEGSEGKTFVHTGKIKKVGPYWGSR